MNLNKEMRTMAFKTVLLFSAVAAFAATDSSLVQKQEELMGKLDSMNSSVFGLRLGGSAKAGVLTSTVLSDELGEDSPSRDNQAYTDINLTLDARPSRETNVHVELTLHKDWQQAYEEGINPVIGHWFSYDGSILNKKLDFNMGYMRVGYTRLTLFTPQVSILQEPTILAEHRVEALAERNLDTTNNRLLQGLNLLYNSGKLGSLENLYAQGTVARLRAIGKKYDQVFFDFDWSDRYLVAARVGAEAFGANLGLNYTYTFDRIRSTRAASGLNPLPAYFYEDNQVLSLDAGFDSKKMMASLPVTFGINGEAAMSMWNYKADSLRTKVEYEYSLQEGINRQNDNVAIGSITSEFSYDTTYYVQVSEKTSNEWELLTLEDDDGLAFYVQPFVKGSIAGFDFDLKATYLQNDENFWSEQASTPVYQANTSILNADAFYSASVDANMLDQFRSGNLENLYFSIYNTNVLNMQNLMSINGSVTLNSDPSKDNSYQLSRLFNNYKLGHFYRNGYNAEVWERKDLITAITQMDPSINMALPLGFATPDRKGIMLDLSSSFKEFVELNARFAKIDRQSIDLSYMEVGLGVKVLFNELLSLQQPLSLSVSGEQSSESTSELTTTRINVGVDFGVNKNWMILLGAQLLSKDYGNSPFQFGIIDPTTQLFIPSSSVTNVDEMLALLGVRYKVAANAYVSLQGGLLNNSISYTDALNVESTIDMNKVVMMADVKVNF